MTYIPDNWVIIELISDDEHIFKVLAGWEGNYLNGDSWRLSSSIEKIEELTDYYVIKNFSSSIYKIHKESEGFSLITKGVYDSLISQQERFSYKVNCLTIKELQTKL